MQIKGEKAGKSVPNIQKYGIMKGAKTGCFPEGLSNMGVESDVLPGGSGAVKHGRIFQPFGGRLRKDNRWVRLAAMMPWEYIEAVYLRNCIHKGIEQ